MPKLINGGVVIPSGEIEMLEEDFYRSLSRLADHYGASELSNTRLYGYPSNIAYSIWETEKFLKRNDKNWDNLRLVRDAHISYLITEERYFTGSTLYYIPIIPLFMMLGDKIRKKTAHLLLSVCSYLYHNANIPYYRQEGSYLYWEYEMLGNWIEEDEETDLTDAYRRELREAEWAGERMEQKLHNRKNLEVFKDRLNHFKAQDDFENECLQIAQNALGLYETYPNERYYRNAGRDNEEDDDEYDYEEETITMDKYVSFYANSEGWLAQNLFECVNNEFNECAKTQEPTICKRFDGSSLTKNNFDFEKKLFTLMDDLIYILNTYHKQTHEQSN